LGELSDQRDGLAFFKDRPEPIWRREPSGLDEGHGQQAVQNVFTDRESVNDGDP